MSHYRRIACLSTEAVETLYALGALQLVCGLGASRANRPPARRVQTF